ncbi:MAG: hypothetical protein LC104_17480 [Bacteroidales bacterium]|nr:hypothetical protein [Bacteroidales bacterium]
MRWAYGIGIGATLVMAMPVVAAEPLSVYPANWTGMQQPTPPKVENLLDTFHKRIATVQATETVPSTVVPPTAFTDTGCATCATATPHVPHLFPRSGRARTIARRIWECYTWTPGPAVIPRGVTYPYPGAWMTSMPPMRSPGFTPTPGYATSCPSCGHSGSPAQADPAGPYRGIVGGPVLMPASGGYVPAIVRTRQSDRVTAPTVPTPAAQPPAAQPPAAQPPTIQPMPSTPIVSESHGKLSRVIRLHKPAYRVDQPYYPVEEEIPIISRVARFFSDEREIAEPVTPAAKRAAPSASSQERVILPTLGTRPSSPLVPTQYQSGHLRTATTPATPPLTLYPNRPFTNP